MRGKLLAHKVKKALCQKVPSFSHIFSNSLVTHYAKQRKSLPWKRFGYGILIIIKFGELFLWISLTIITASRSYMKQSKRVFHQIPNTSKLVKKNSATPRFFFNSVRVWKCWWNTLPRVYNTSKLNPASFQCVFFLVVWVMKRQELFLQKNTGILLGNVTLSSGPHLLRKWRSPQERDDLSLWFPL